MRAQTLSTFGLSVLLVLTAFANARADASLEHVRAFSNGVHLRLSGPAAYEAYKLQSPPRIVIDLHGTRHQGKPRRLYLGGDQILTVRSDQYASAPGWTARVVVDLMRDADFEARREGPNISLRLTPRPDPEELRDAVAPLAPPAAGRATLSDIVIDGNRAALLLSRQAEHEVFYMSDPPRLIIDLKDTRRARWLRRRSDSPGVLREARSGIFSRGGIPYTRVVLDVEREVPFRLDWNGGRLSVLFTVPGEEAAAGLQPGVRAFDGLLADADGAGLSGKYLLSFFWPGTESDEFWSESVYVNADKGFFSARLGLLHSVPLHAKIDVATPPGSGWRVISTGPQ
ncbi:MAG: AMIN domain-containing protein [Elusimicrobiota bacterium]